MLKERIGKRAIAFGRNLFRLKKIKSTFHDIKSCISLNQLRSSHNQYNRSNYRYHMIERNLTYFFTPSTVTLQSVLF